MVSTRQALAASPLAGGTFLMAAKFTVGVAIDAEANV
jgi:hypothetical protein